MNFNIRITVHAGDNKASTVIDASVEDSDNIYNEVTLIFDQSNELLRTVAKVYEKDV